MINISKLTTDEWEGSSVGKWVLYTPFPGAKKEKGRIKSWNDKFIFVVYNCNNQWSRFEDYTAAATNPEHLQFMPDPEVLQKLSNIISTMENKTEDNSISDLKDSLDNLR